MIRPLKRTVVIAVTGVVCVGVGWAIASPAAAGVGVLLVTAIVIDALRFSIAEARAPAVHLARSAEPNPCTAGETMTIHLVPGATRARTPQIMASDLEETLPRDLSTHVGPHDQGPHASGLAYDVTPYRRGQWVLGPCFIMRFSSLGLWWTRVADTSVCQITAWPRTVELQIPGLAQDHEGVVGRTGMLRPHQDNAIVRAYQFGDDLRRVHWRSSARRGELMTRAEEPTDAEHAWVGLGLPAGVPAERRELAISLAASWIVCMESVGYTVDLACGGETHDGSAHSHLTRLAALTGAELELALPSNPPEGVSLLVAAHSTVHGLPGGYIVNPPWGRGPTGRASSAVAAVISGSDADVQMAESAGWSVLRLDDSMNLEAAGHRLSRYVLALQEEMR